jgi:hypothetical protein
MTGVGNQLLEVLQGDKAVVHAAEEPQARLCNLHGRLTQMAQDSKGNYDESRQSTIRFNNKVLIGTKNRLNSSAVVWLTRSVFID